MSVRDTRHLNLVVKEWICSDDLNVGIEKDIEDDEWTGENIKLKGKTTKEPFLDVMDFVTSQKVRVKTKKTWTTWMLCIMKTMHEPINTTSKNSFRSNYSSRCRIAWNHPTANGGDSAFKR